MFLNQRPTDTLLNVFLAIAVDNLANAQELTKVTYTPTTNHITPHISTEIHLIISNLSQMVIYIYIYIYIVYVF